MGDRRGMWMGTRDREGVDDAVLLHQERRAQFIKFIFRHVSSSLSLSSIETAPREK